MASRRPPAVVAAVVALAAVATLALSARPARAGDRPDTEHLVLAGVGMAIPTYFLGVACHEGSHALTGVLLGHRIIDYSLLPGRHPQNGKFYFGYVQIDGQLSTGEKTVFLLAPKITDAVFLGGYAALVGFDALPDNRYAQLALVVLATGFWVDFSKDILPAAEHHDMPRLYRMAGLESEWKRLPLRIAHAAVSAAAAYALYRGYERVFANAADPAQLGASGPAVPLGPDGLAAIRFALPLADWRF